MYKVFGLVLLGIALVGCVSAPQSSGVVVGERRIVWKDFRKVSSYHRAEYPMAAGESVYLFVWSWAEPVEITLPSGKTVAGTPEACPSYAIGESRIVKEPNIFGGTGPEEFDMKIATQARQECQAILRKAEASRTAAPLSKTGFITLAERAVQQDGQCVWLGYDQSLDAAIRSDVSGMFGDRDSYFFAPMRCG